MAGHLIDAGKGGQTFVAADRTFGGWGDGDVFPGRKGGQGKG